MSRSKARRPSCSGQNSLGPLGRSERHLSSREDESEGRPLFFGRANLDLASKSASQASREHEPDAGAWIALALARIELMKLLEELRQIVRGNSAPRVRHGDTNLTRQSPQRQDDLSLLREFDRVRQEVEKD